MKSQPDNKAGGASAKNLKSSSGAISARDSSARVSEKLFQIALRAVARQRLTEHQLRERIVKKISQQWYDYLTKNISQEFLKDEIDKVLGRMKHLGYINDTEFTQMFIRDTLQRRPHGSMWIKAQLIKKGIDASLIAEAMQMMREEGSADTNSIESDKQRSGADDKPTGDMEYGAARVAAEKKLRTLAREEPKKRYEKLFRFLCSRGFTASMAFRVLDELGLLRSGDLRDNSENSDSI